MKPMIIQVGIQLMEPSLTIGCNALDLQPVKTRFVQVVFQPADPICTIGCYALEPRRGSYR